MRVSIRTSWMLGVKLILYSIRDESIFVDLIGFWGVFEAFWITLKCKKQWRGVTLELGGVATFKKSNSNPWPYPWIIYEFYEIFEF